MNLLLNFILSATETDQTFLVMQGNPQLADQDHIQMTSKDLQEWRFLTDQPVAVLGDPQRKKPKSFLIFRGNLLCFSLWSLPLILSL